MSSRDLIAQRLRAYDPDLDLNDPRLIREVIEPLVEYIGDELPAADPRRLMQARLAEEFPDLDGSVFADLFGKAAQSLLSVLRIELSAARNRRRLDDPRLLTGKDLSNLRDFFLLDPTEGTFSRGTLRAFFPSPRSLALDVGTLITVNGRDGGAPRVYRPTTPQTFSVSEMRENREGGQFYVDVALTATAPGAYYDLQPNEALGATGIPGAVRLINLLPFRGGGEADSAPQFLARIRAAVRARDTSSFAGAEYILPQNQIFDFQVIQGGDPLMVRDRVYGPVQISGIPGGFRINNDSAAPDSFIQLGIASDVWHALSSEATTGARIRVLEDVGVEVFLGRVDSVAFAPGNPGTFTATLSGNPLIETIGTPDLFPPGVPAPRPVVPGDLVNLSGVFDVFGRRIPLAVTSVNSLPSGDELQLQVVNIEDDPASFSGLGTSAISILRRAVAYRSRFPHFPSVPESVQHFFSAPLFDTRAFGADGEEVLSQGVPALPVPGTVRPESRAGALVPQYRNILQDADDLPFTSIERVELLDAITEQPTGTYLYPRIPLFCEFQETLAGSLQDKVTKLRVHLLGPQATALGRTVVQDLPGLDGHRMTPLFWPSTPAEAAASDDPTTGVIVLAAAPGPLTSGSVTVPREPREGDWIHFRTPSYEEYFPIVEVNGTEIRVAAQDIPVGAEGSAVIFQGATRASLQAVSPAFPTPRGPEGTYSFDIWLRELTPSEAGDPGYVPPESPLFGTRAFIPEDGWLTQGFEVVSTYPGQQFSTQERASLCIQGNYVGDGEELQGRSVTLHAYPGDEVKTVQRVFDEDGRLIKTALAKAYAPTFVTCSFFYDALDLDPEDAAQAIYQEVLRSQEDQRIELSDLKEALIRAGADFVVSGRIFVLRQDHNRKWEYFATRGAVPLLSIGQLRLSAVTCTRLRRRARGESPDEFDPDSWEGDPFTLRPGGFDED